MYKSIFAYIDTRSTPFESLSSSLLLRLIIVSCGAFGCTASFGFFAYLLAIFCLEISQIKKSHFARRIPYSSELLSSVSVGCFARPAVRRASTQFEDELAARRSFLLVFPVIRKTAAGSTPHPA